MAPDRVPHPTLTAGRPVLSPVVVLGAHLVLALAFTWPAAATFGTRVICDLWDSGMFLWSVWWTPHAIFELHQWPFHTEQLFAPGGVSLAFHTGVFLPSLLASPIQRVFGTVAALNSIMIGSCAFSGLAFFLLARDVAEDGLAAFVGSVAFAYGHCRAWMLMFPNLAQSEFLVFFAWALLRSRRRASPGWAALAGVFAACVAYSCPVLFTFTAVLGVGFALVAVVGCLRSRQSLRAPLVEWLVLGGVLAVLVSPLAVEMIREVSAHGDYLYISNRDEALRSVPMLRWFQYGPLHGMRGGLLWHVLDASFLGWATVALAVIGFVTHRGRAIALGGLALAAFGLILNLGPHFNWSMPPDLTPKALADSPQLPFAWLKYVPILRSVAGGHRWGLLGWLGVSTGAALGVQTLLSRWGSSTLRRGAIGCACALLVFADFVRWPFPLIHDVPIQGVEAIAKQMREDPRQVSVLEYPSGQGGAPSFAFFDTLHEKPVYLGGSLARTPPAVVDAVLRSPVMGLLYRAWTEGEWDPAWMDELDPRAEVAAGHIGWVALSWDRWGACDPGVSSKRSRGIEPEMRALDLAIRAAFPTAKVEYQGRSDEMFAWFAESSCDGRHKRSPIYRVYRVETP